jgi:uncharacterized protein (DUF1810 family)
MWFIFPQLHGLGTSVYAELYGLRDVQEAKLYLEDQTLGSRLRECVAILVRQGHLTSVHIFPRPGDLKLHACLTLFDRASPEDVFETALIQFFGGVRHLQTMNAIAGLEKTADSIVHRMLHCISSLTRPRP